MKPVCVPSDAPVFDELFVVSDLHLGGRKDLQMFVAGRSFFDWVMQTVIPAFAPRKSTATKVKRRVALVINGDFIDFLAAPENDRPYAPHFNPKLALHTLATLAVDCEASFVFKALFEFVRNPDASLIITLGNHDLELASPTVQSQLLDLIARQDHKARKRISFQLEEDGFVCRVGSDGIWCVHGNSDDAWNRVDRSRLQREVAHFEVHNLVSDWKPNPGTQLVMDLLNHVKQDYRFVELLKPETQAVPPLLLMLAPEKQDLIEASLSAVTYRCGSWLRDWARKFLSTEQFLQSSSRPESEHSRLQLLRALVVFPRNTLSFDASNDAEELLYNAHMRVVARLQQASQQHSNITSQTYSPSFRSTDSPVSGNEERLLGWWKAFVTAGRGGSDIEVIQAFLAELQQYRGFDVDDTADSQYRAFASDFRNTAYKPADGSKSALQFPSIVITGHTHQARRNLPLGRYAEGRYFNSGTWAQVMRIPPEIINDTGKLQILVENLRQKGNPRVLNDTHLVWSPMTYIHVRKASAGQAECQLLSMGSVGITPSPPGP